MNYSISNEVWEYMISTDDKGLIISVNKSPNGRPHWCIGWTIDELKKYYHREKSNNGPSPAVIKEIK